MRAQPGYLTRVDDDTILFYFYILNGYAEFFCYRDDTQMGCNTSSDKFVNGEILLTE